MMVSSIKILQNLPIFKNIQKKKHKVFIYEIPLIKSTFLFTFLEQITCKHSYSTQCHITYKTDYEPQQEEECEENYRKKCFIEFKAVASKEKVEFCYTPLVKNCDIPGPEECSTEYRSECMTR